MWPIQMVWGQRGIHILQQTLQVSYARFEGLYVVPRTMQASPGVLDQAVDATLYTVLA